jgi:triosephosphate isomerase
MNKIIIGNWKMYKSVAETQAHCARLKAAVQGLDGVDVGVAPPATALWAAVHELGGTDVSVYAQNVHWEDEGAFTGELSAPMLREIGVVGAIVGHSERRQHFGETDETVARRTAHALEAGLHVVACVGELEEEREADRTEEVLRRQVQAIADAVGWAGEGSVPGWLVLAYEPVWAIGTGKTATPEQAQAAHALIRSLLDVPILYGGSVKPDNARELLSQPDVDGALVGGASLDVDSFVAICRAAIRS